MAREYPHPWARSTTRRAASRNSLGAANDGAANDGAANRGQAVAPGFGYDAYFLDPDQRPMRNSPKPSSATTTIQKPITSKCMKLQNSIDSTTSSTTAAAMNKMMRAMLQEYAASVRWRASERRNAPPSPKEPA